MAQAQLTSRPFRKSCCQIGTARGCTWATLWRPRSRRTMLSSARWVGQVDRNGTKVSTATVRSCGPGAALAVGHRRQSPRRTGSGGGRYLLAGSALSPTTPSGWGCVGGSITLTTGMTVSLDGNGVLLSRAVWAWWRDARRGRCLVPCRVTVVACLRCRLITWAW